MGDRRGAADSAPQPPRADHAWSSLRWSPVRVDGTKIVVAYESGGCVVRGPGEVPVRALAAERRDAVTIAVYAAASNPCAVVGLHGERSSRSRGYLATGAWCTRPSTTVEPLAFRPACGRRLRHRGNGNRSGNRWEQVVSPQSFSRPLLSHSEPASFQAKPGRNGRRLKARRSLLRSRPLVRIQVGALDGILPVAAPRRSPANADSPLPCCPPVRAIRSP